MAAAQGAFVNELTGEEMLGIEGAPATGSSMKANMSQPVRKGVAKWTDVIRKLAVRMRTLGPTRGCAWWGVRGRAVGALYLAWVGSWRPCAGV